MSHDAGNISPRVETARVAEKLILMNAILRKFCFAKRVLNTKGLSSTQIELFDHFEDPHPSQFRLGKFLRSLIPIPLEDVLVIRANSFTYSLQHACKYLSADPSTKLKFYIVSPELVLALCF